MPGPGILEWYVKALFLPPSLSFLPSPDVGEQVLAGLSQILKNQSQHLTNLSQILKHQGLSTFIDW